MSAFKLKSFALVAILALGCIIAQACGPEVGTTCALTNPLKSGPPPDECLVQKGCEVQSDGTEPSSDECWYDGKYGPVRRCVKKEGVDSDGDCTSDGNERLYCTCNQVCIEDAVQDPDIFPSAPDADGNHFDSDCDGRDAPRAGMVPNDGGVSSSGGTGSSSSSSSSSGGASSSSGSVGPNVGGLGGSPCSCDGKTRLFYSSFQNGTDGWTREDHHVEDTGIMVVSGEMKVQSSGSWATDDESMVRHDLQITQGHVYCITMAVHADPPKPFKYQTRRTYGQWSAYDTAYNAAVQADSTRTLKSGRFTAPETATAQVVIMVGRDTNPLFADDVNACEL